jgi:DNA-binding IclR family transcriptional regulator
MCGAANCIASCRARHPSSSGKPVVAAARALAILNAFTVEAHHLGLTDVARRVGLPKTTTLRLLKTLEASGYVAQDEFARWRLGPATASLGARYQVSFDIRANVEPAMRRLSDSTGQDISFFVQDGNRRIRLVKMMCPTAQHAQSIVGESMPLDQGAAGRVMLAAMGQQGEVYDAIRHRGYHITVGEAKKRGASIAVPVFGSRWRVVGALCIGAPAGENASAELSKFASKLKRAAASLSAALSYDADDATQRVKVARSSWHP